MACHGGDLLTGSFQGHRSGTLDEGYARRHQCADQNGSRQVVDEYGQVVPFDGAGLQLGGIPRVLNSQQLRTIRLRGSVRA